MLCMHVAFVHVSLYERARLKDVLCGLVGVTSLHGFLECRFNSCQLSKGRIVI